MLARLIRRLNEGEQGVTGLETAIILIAGVVVASVFAYTVLSAGIFSAEKGKEAIHSALGLVGSAMSLAGPVIAEDTDSDDEVERIVFTVRSAGDGAIDLRVTTDVDADGLLSDEANRVHTMSISLQDENQRIEDLTWTKSQLGRGDGDDLLEDHEKFQITVDLTALTTALKAYDTFTLELTPADGSPFAIERSLPGQVDAVMDLR